MERALEEQLTTLFNNASFHYSRMPQNPFKGRVFWPVVLTTTLILLSVIGVAIILTRPENEQADETTYYHSGAVAADVGMCSDIGVKILKDGGAAVDSAIATLFCQGATNIHSSGIGGGLFMVVYDKKLGKAWFYNGREKAPAKATRDMFVNNAEAAKNGALAVGVPGEVSAMYRAWREHGKLPWKDLVKPAIDLCKKGFPLPDVLYAQMQQKKELLYNDTGFRKLFFKTDGSALKLNETLINPELGSTLEKIAEDPMSFYHGSIAQQIVRDIQQAGGIITRSDMRNYDAGRALALEVALNKHNIWTSRPPSSGPVLAMILKILKGYNFNSKDHEGDSNFVRTYHRIIEAFKFSYSYRALLGDPDFEDIEETVTKMTSQSFTEELRRKINDNKIENVSYYGGFYSDWNDEGTTHLSVLSKEGDAVAVTSTINTVFGAKMRSPSLGFVYNNEMDDFSTPGQVNTFGVEPSPKNFIKPNKRMMSSMSPTIMVDHLGNVKLILGASGGTRITTGVAQVFMNHLWFGQDLVKSVKSPRLHHQLVPQYIRAEEKQGYRMKQAILDGLTKLGHQYKFFNTTSTVQVISVDGQGRIRAVSDPRKDGRAAGY